MNTPANVSIRSVASVVFVLSLTAAIAADTLYLRNGTRVEGELVAVRDQIIEFAEDRGFGSPRIREFSRNDVLRIDLEPRRVPPPGRGSGRPIGMRERRVVVSADVPFVDTGIDVRVGQQIYLEASGQVRWGTGDRRDGPDGQRNSPTNPNRPIPTRPAGALIGKITRESTDVFFVGSQAGPFRMRTTGRLFLGINDDYLPDNSGSFLVMVYY